MRFASTRLPMYESTSSAIVSSPVEQSSIKVLQLSISTCQSGVSKTRLMDLLIHSYKVRVWAEARWDDEVRLRGFRRTRVSAFSRILFEVGFGTADRKTLS